MNVPGDKWINRQHACKRKRGGTLRLTWFLRRVYHLLTGENTAMLRDGNILHVAIYTSGSVFLGILATYLGNVIIKSF